MGQKVNPLSIRLGFIKDTSSRWFGRHADFGLFLEEDVKIRRHIKYRTEIEEALNSEPTWKLKTEKWLKTPKRQQTKRLTTDFENNPTNIIEDIREKLVKRMHSKSRYSNKIDNKRNTFRFYYTIENGARMCERIRYNPDKGALLLCSWFEKHTSDMKSAVREKPIL